MGAVTLIPTGLRSQEYGAPTRTYTYTNTHGQLLYFMSAGVHFIESIKETTSERVRDLLHTLLHSSGFGLGGSHQLAPLLT